MNELATQNEMPLAAINAPAAIAALKQNVHIVQTVMRDVMHEGEHYGTIPGCGDKKVLMKSGAEKLGFVFRLKPTFSITQHDLANGHREYEIKTTLSDGTEGVGCCSTMEGKYRFRQGERKCPQCGKAAIIKGKQEYGGGWLCFDKKGGCKAKYKDGDKSIESQNAERTEHDNPADFYNTCLKMAKKRSHVDAIITATAASDIFTQDMEEDAPQAQKDVRAQYTKPAQNNAPQAPQAPQNEPPEPGSFEPDFERPAYEDLGVRSFGPETPADIPKGVKKGMGELTPCGPEEITFIEGTKPVTNKKTGKPGPYNFVAADSRKFFFWGKNEALKNIMDAAWNSTKKCRRFSVEWLESQNGKFTNREIQNVTPIFSA